MQRGSENKQDGQSAWAAHDQPAPGRAAPARPTLLQVLRRLGLALGQARLTLVTVATVVGLGLDLAGHTGHLGFVLPCTLFVLLLVAASWTPRHQTGRHQPSQGADATHDGETLFMPPPPPPLPGMMAVLDEAHRCVDVSPQLARWLHTDRDHLLGTDLSAWLGGAADAVLGPQVDAALAGSTRRLCCSHVSADGALRWLQLQLQPRTDAYGEPDGCELFAMDISTEQRALQDAQQQLRRLQQMLDAVPSQVSCIGHDGRYRHVNLAHAQALGQGRSQLQDSPASATLDEHSAAACLLDLEAVQKGAILSVTRQSTNRHGQPIWLTGQASPELDEDGQVVGMITVLQTQAETTSETPPTARTQAEADALPALGPGGRARPWSSALPPTVHQLLGLGAGAGEVGEALDFELHELVDDVVQLMAPRAQARRVTLISRVDPSLPQALRGDPYRLRQLLTTVVAEALSTQHEGELLVHAQREAADQLLISVLTPGQAVPRPDAGQNTDADTASTSLGLSMARQVLAELGGSLCWLPEGHGLQLPLQAASCQPGNDLPDGLVGRHVLVLPASANQGAALTQLLLSHGLHASQASNLADALALLRQSRHSGCAIDLVLMHACAQHPTDDTAETGAPQGDSTPEALDSLDRLLLAQALRADPSLAHVRLVLAGPRPAPAWQARARQAGVHGWLRLPARRGDLFHALAQALALPTAAHTVVECLTLGAAEKASSTPAPAAPRLPTPTALVEACASTALPMFHARVLLADDHPADQAQVGAMLHSLGCELATASDGDQAEHLLRTEHFDLLLVACQLPLQDSVALARTIRAREARLPRGRRLPVLALGAPGQGQDDAGQALATGLDDLLAKPCSPLQLAQALQRWLPPQLVELPAPAQPAQPAPAAAPAAPAVSHSLGHSSAAPHPVPAERVALYLDGLGAMLQALDQHLVDNDPAALAQAAQDLRVASSGVGATALAELCRRLENLAGSGELAGLPDLVDAAHALAQRLLPVPGSGQRLLA